MADGAWVAGMTGAALAIAAVAIAYALFVVTRHADGPLSVRAPDSGPKKAKATSRPPPRQPERGRGAESEAPDSSRTLEAAPPLEAGFLGLVSHELRTPLTAMQLLLDRLSDGSSELPPRQRKLVERLGGTAVRLTDLVDSILYYARIQSGRLVTSVEPFDLAALATAVAEEQRALAERKGLVLDISGARDAIFIENDPKLLRLVIVNLVSNAVKFTERGQITVAVESLGNRRILRVTDSGSGIPAAELKRIFEPFQNVEATRHKHLPGIGLGLSLARQIVDNLGGEITVRSEPDLGSTFTVSLPAVPRRVPTPPPPPPHESTP